MVERRREVGAPVALTEYNGADIVALFREEGGEVFAESWDMTKPEMADKVVQEVGRVDILIANLAYPHTYAPAPTRRRRRSRICHAKDHVSAASADAGRPASDA